MTKKSVAIYLIGIGILLILAVAWYASAFLTQPEPAFFNGQRALAHVETQVAFGPRISGSAGHAQAVEWMRAELSAAGWDSRIQSGEMLGHPIQNVIAYRGEELPQIILAAHYDTRIFADKDPDPLKQLEPVPGANDGASGVAVLQSSSISQSSGQPGAFGSMIPSPQRRNVQSVRQEASGSSELLSNPSSHCSTPVTNPSPQNSPAHV